MAVVFLLETDVDGIFLLNCPILSVNIAACCGIVNVGYLVNVLNILAGHLQNRKDECLIPRSPEELPVCISEILLLNRQKQISPKRSQMPEFLNNLTVVLVFNNDGCIRLRVPLREILFLLGIMDMIGVSKAWIFGLIDGVEKLENISTT